MWRITPLLLSIVVSLSQAEYQIRVYRGAKSINDATQDTIEEGSELSVPGEYTLEIWSDEPMKEDYLIESCTVQETGEVFVRNGCLSCTDVFILMQETSGYTVASGQVKRSSIFFRPKTRKMTFKCKLGLYDPGMMDRACDKSMIGILSFDNKLGERTLKWGGHGWPWWAWLLLALLLLLLLCCIIGAIIAVFMLLGKKKKNQAQVQPSPVGHGQISNLAMYPEKERSIAGTHVSDIAKNSVILDATSLNETRPPIDTAQLASIGPEKVEVFSGHAGVYNVRDGSIRQIGRGGVEHPIYREEDNRDRQSYNNYGYEPDNTVNCVEGYDEVVRYHKDREIGEYDNVEHEIETTHTRRFIEDHTPRYFDTRRVSVPV